MTGVPRAQRVPVAAGEPLLGGAEPDYADAFEIRLTTPDDRTAEEFARSALEEAAWPVRAGARFAQRRLLGFRLGPKDSPAHVFGWRIVTVRPEVIQLEAESAVFRGVIVGRRVDSTTRVMTTYAFYRRRGIGRVLWAAISPMHRRTAAYILRRAAAANPQARSSQDHRSQVP